MKPQGALAKSTLQNRNSSITRVRPVFSRLISADASGDKVPRPGHRERPEPRTQLRQEWRSCVHRATLRRIISGRA